MISSLNNPNKLDTMAYYTASSMTTTTAGVTRWKDSPDAPLRGPSHDANGALLQYTVTTDNFFFSAIGTDGVTYNARRFYFSSLSADEMHPEENFFHRCTNIDRRFTLSVSAIAIGIVFLSGILMAKFINY